MVFGSILVGEQVEKAPAALARDKSLGLSVYRETDVTYPAPFMRGHQWPEKLLDAMHLFQIQKYREDIY